MTCIFRDVVYEHVNHRVLALRVGAARRLLDLDVRNDSTLEHGLCVGQTLLFEAGAEAVLSGYIRVVEGDFDGEFGLRWNLAQLRLQN